MAPDACSLTCLPPASEPHLRRTHPLLPLPAWASASMKPPHPPLDAFASLPHGCCACLSLSIFYRDSRQFQVWDHISGKCPWWAHCRKHGDVG